MWLAIEGVVGAGKTTTGTLVSRLSGAVACLESLDEHPLLEAYYREPESYAVETELIFMSIQRHHLRQVFSHDLLVTDFAPAKNLIFARLETQGDDLRLLEIVDAQLWRGLPKPDMTVVLDVPVEVCKERLTARGRPYELGISTDDLDRIRDGYLVALDSLGTEVKRIELTGAEHPEAVARDVMEMAGLSPEGLNSAA